MGFRLVKVALPRLLLRSDMDSQSARISNDAPRKTTSRIQGIRLVFLIAGACLELAGYAHVEDLSAGEPAVDGGAGVAGQHTHRGGELAADVAARRAVTAEGSAGGRGHRAVVGEATRAGAAGDRSTAGAAAVPAGRGGLSAIPGARGGSAVAADRGHGGPGR